jgi:hypothetical protein
MIMFLIAGAVLLIGGCGQSNPTINTSNPQPSGLKLKGVVRTTTLNSTIGDPIAGAFVSLSGDKANQTVVTNANGEYVIENVPDGSYNLIVTAEGHTRNSTTAVAVAIKPSSNIPADNTITVTDIQLDSNPIILSYSPTPMSVVGNRPTIVVTFNEVMDASSVVPTLAAAGIRTMVAGPSTVPLTGTWDSSTSPRVLTLVPQADLISNETYTLTINGSAMDAAGYAISSAPEQAQELSPEFRVTTGGVPGAPGNVLVVVGTMPMSYEAGVGPDYANVFNAGNVGFYWTPSSGVVTGYRVYVANSTTGNYHLIGTSTGNANFMDFSMANIITALYNGTVDPLGTLNYPMINLPLYVKVVAFNGDGESAAASTSAIELVGPRLSATAKRQATWGTDTVLNNNYVLPAITDANTAYIAFVEPVDAATATNIANYSIAGGNVLSATLMTNSSAVLTTFAAGTYAIIKIQADIAVVGAAITSKLGGVKDLAGNTALADTSATP